VLNEPEELIFSVLAPRMEEEPEGDEEETGEEGEEGENPLQKKGKKNRDSGLPEKGALFH
jgi:hypothetical protein